MAQEPERLPHGFRERLEELFSNLRQGVLYLRRLVLPSSGLMIGEARLSCKDDGDGNIDPYWRRPDGTESNLSIGGSAGGAPADVNYLVGTADGDLSAEIPVGTTPGGELGGSWASPTVDSTHSGSPHSAHLLASGTRAGSTGQAQDFGSTGITVDVIAESTGAAGVTIDSLLVKDSQVTFNGAVLLRHLNAEVLALRDDTDSNYASLIIAGLATDTIGETTNNAGVTVDSVLIKDGEVDGVVVDAHAARHTDGSDDIQDAQADDSTKGISTFEADDFDDASGKIDLATSVAKSVPTDSGTATPSGHALTIAGGTNVTTAGSGSTVTVNLDTLYSVHQYVFTPDAAPGEDVETGAHQGTIHVSGPSNETVKRITSIAETASATAFTFTLDYDSGNDDFDSFTVDTEIDEVAMGTAKGVVTTSGFTNATIVAQSLISLDVTTVTGAPKDVTIILEVWRPLQT